MTEKETKKLKEENQELKIEIKRMGSSISRLIGMIDKQEETK